MARDLSFSISNILRSDFPSPSRISARPRILYVEPLREKKEAVQAFQYATGKLNQAEASLGNDSLWTLCSTEAQENDICPELLTSDCISLLEEPKEGKDVHLFVLISSLSREFS